MASVVASVVASPVLASPVLPVALPVPGPVGVSPVVPFAVEVPPVSPVEPGSVLVVFPVVASVSEPLHPGTAASRPTATKPPCIPNQSSIIRQYVDFAVHVK